MGMDLEIVGRKRVRGKSVFKEFNARQTPDEVTYLCVNSRDAGPYKRWLEESGDFEALAAIEEFEQECRAEGFELLFLM